MPTPVPPEWAAEFGNDSVLQRPELATRIGAVAAAWSHCELQLGQFLSELCSNDHRAALAIIERFGTLTSRIQAVQSVAVAVLPEKQKQDLIPMLRRFESVGKERNKIVHGIWGISHQAIDALLWCPPAAQIGMRRSFLEEFLAGRADEALMSLRVSWEAWRLNDFQRVADEIFALTKDFVAVSNSINLDRITNGQISYEASLARMRSPTPLS